jgi:DNA-binding NarL/FixJ family response regulator
MEVTLLTPREQQVLVRVAFGWSNEQIGAELGITKETVRTHVENTLHRLGARNRSHAVGIAYRAGMLRHS